MKNLCNLLSLAVHSVNNFYTLQLDLLHEWGVWGYWHFRLKIINKIIEMEDCEKTADDNWWSSNLIAFSVVLSINLWFCVRNSACQKWRFFPLRRVNKEYKKEIPMFSRSPSELCKKNRFSHVCDLLAPRNNRWARQLIDSIPISGLFQTERLGLTSRRSESSLLRKKKLRQMEKIQKIRAEQNNRVICYVAEKVWIS